MAAADAASTEATYERQASRAFLAGAYMFAQRWSEAIQTYRAALEIANKGGTNDTTRYLRGIAAAQANLGDLSAADQTVASAMSQKEKLVAGASSQGDRAIHSDRTSLDLCSGRANQTAARRRSWGRHSGRQGSRTRRPLMAPIRPRINASV